MNYERAITKIISICTKYFFRVKKKLKQINPYSTPKVTVRSLVPVCGRGFGHEKSRSLAAREANSIKPFELYSVRKEELQSTGVNTQENISQFGRNARLITEEIPKEHVSIGVKIAGNKD